MPYVMTEKDIIGIVSANLGLDNLDVKVIIREIFGVISDMVAKQSIVRIEGFGTFRSITTTVYGVQKCHIFLVPSNHLRKKAQKELLLKLAYPSMQDSNNILDGTTSP